MVAGPAAIPVTIPVLPMLAAVPPALHIPPPLSVSDSVWPGHIPVLKIPVIAPGNGFTVIAAVRIQPDGRV